MATSFWSRIENALESADKATAEQLHSAIGKKKDPPRRAIDEDVPESPYQPKASPHAKPLPRKKQPIPEDVFARLDEPVYAKRENYGRSSDDGSDIVDEESEEEERMLRKEKLRMERELESKKKRMASLEAKLKKSRQEVKSLQRMLSAREDELNEMEKQANKERQELEEERHRLQDNIQVLERTSTEQSMQLSDIQHQIHQKTARIGQLETQNGSLRTTMDRYRKELSDYKARAAKVLREKEGKLKEGDDEEKEHITLSLEDWSAWTHEREMLRADVESGLASAEEMKSTIERLESEVVDARVERDTKIRESQVAVETSSQECRRLEADLASYRSEFASARDEVGRTRKAGRAVELKLKQEVEQLQAQLLRKRNSTETQDIEERLRVMADQVFKKQSEIEQLKSRLQAMEVDHQAIEMERSASPREDDRVHRRGFVMLESNLPSTASPFRREVTRAAQAVDRLSIHTGNYLRRDPRLRVALALYMTVLHIWVFFVITRTPIPMHEDE